LEYFGFLGPRPVSGISSPARLRACFAAEFNAVCAVWNDDMRALKIAGAALAAVVAVIALLLAIGIPSGFLKGQIETRIERETGYKLAINGGARIGLWPSLHITLNDVTLQDPKDRDINNRLTAGSIQADMTLASLWAGRPRVTELVIVRPVLNLPLQRERVKEPGAVSKPAPARATEAFSIEHVSVTGGTIVFSNLRDRVENRIETVNADITIDDDRKVTLTGNARSGGYPLKFAIMAAPPAPPVERQNIPTEFKLEAPDLLPAALSAKAGVRLNGAVVMINGVTGTLGDGAFNGWASVDLASKPLVKLDLDFQRLAVATARGGAGAAAQPWSHATIDLNGLNYIDAQARISAAELAVGDGRFAPAAIEATLASGVLKAQVSNIGAYDGSANGELTIDVSTANPTFAMRADLAGVRALPLLRSLAGFDKLDGKMQARISVRSNGASQRAIMSNMSGTAFVVFQDGAIKGLNVAQMIRSLTSGTLSGWQEGQDKATDLAQLSASFKIDKGQAQTTDLNLVGPLVRMTGVGTIDLGTKQIGFRVEPKLVMTTEGQGRAADPVGLGIPVMIEGPWGEPRIYPEMQGILDNPEAAYAKLKEMGKGLFGPNGGGLGAALGSLLGGGQGAAGAPGGASQPANPLGEAIGNLLQQGLSGGLGQSPGQSSPGQSAARPSGQPSGQRSIPSPTQAPAQAAPAEPAAPTAGSAEMQPESQPMNEVLRQLFNR
jgi:AsmA protein